MEYTLLTVHTNWRWVHSVHLCAPPPLFSKVIAERDSLPGDHHPPLVVKISPDLTPAEREDIAACVCRPHPHRNPDGLVITNTTMSRPESLWSEHKNESGGLSGQPIREMSTEAIRDMYRLTGGTVCCA